MIVRCISVVLQLSRHIIAVHQFYDGITSVCVTGCGISIGNMSINGVVFVEEVFKDDQKDDQT